MQFVCHTAYHVYVACVIQLLEKHERCGITLMDNIPGFEKYADRLRAEGIFDEVRAIRHAQMYPQRTKGSFHLAYLYGRLFPRRAHACLSFLLDDEVYLFTDYSNVGGYLMRRRKSYHLLEDGCNTFANDVHRMSGRQRMLKGVLNRVFGIPHSMGMSPLCLDVEVNDLSKVKTKFSCPVHEKNRSEMVKRLSQADIDRLLRVFALNFSMQQEGRSLLLITQPLCEMYVTQSDEETVRFYERALERYRGEYRIYVKPHPRDGADYGRMFGGDVTVIDRSVPIEILNHKQGVLFDLGVSYSSTSVNGISFCKETKQIEGVSA